MIRNAKNLLIGLILAVSGVLVLAPAAVTYAGKPTTPASSASTTPTTDPVNSDACSGLNQLSSSGDVCGAASGSSVDNLLRVVLNIFSAIVGFIAVIMVIINGLKMITSNGDSNALASARNGLIYAAVGLAIIALAQVIVHFVLKSVSS